MNIFKINQCFALNLFAFSGYLTLLLLPWCLQQNILGLAILSHVYLIGLFLPWICFLFFITTIEYFIKGKKLNFQFNDKYRSNLFAKCYFWLGIFLNILSVIMPLFYLTGLFIFLHYSK